MSSFIGEPAPRGQLRCERLYRCFSAKETRLMAFKSLVDLYIPQRKGFYRFTVTIRNL